MLFGHKSVISSASKLNIESKNFFTKVVQFGILCENFIEKVKVKMSFGHKTVISSLSKPNTFAVPAAITSIMLITAIKVITAIMVISFITVIRAITAGFFH